MNEIAFGTAKWMAYAIFLWLAYTFLKTRLSGYALILAAGAIAFVVSVLLTAFTIGGGAGAIGAVMAGYGRPAFVITFVLAGMHFLNLRKKTQ